MVTTCSAFARATSPRRKYASDAGSVAIFVGCAIDVEEAREVAFVPRRRVMRIREGEDAVPILQRRTGADEHGKVSAAKVFGAAWLYSVQM